MKKYIEKEIIKNEEILDKIICDVCKKEINSKYYYEVTTSHGDWGNDSWESLHIYDICSDECLSNMFDEYLEFKSNTKKLEIEKVSRKSEIG